MSLTKLNLGKAAVVAATAALPFLASPASAQPVTGLYIGAGAGWNAVQKSDLSASGALSGALRSAGVNTSGSLRFDDGFVGVVSLGWGFGNGIRAEVEGNFRQNGAHKLGGFGPLAPFTEAGGIQRSYGVMANVFYDFDLANFGLGQSVVQPYIGGGIGYIWTDWHNMRARSLGTGLQVVSDDTDGQFAFQGIAGLATPLTWLGVTGLTLTAEYRFAGTLEPSMSARVLSANGATVARGSMDAQNYNHSVLVGLRYAFNQPRVMAAAPAPAPAQELARTYLVHPAAPRPRGSKWPAMPTVPGRRPITSACRSAVPKRWRRSWCATASTAMKSA